MARRWWSSAIGSDAAETWVSKEDGRVSAFCVLITDEECWAAEEKQREYQAILIGLRFLAFARARWCAIRREAAGSETSSGNKAAESHNHRCKRHKRTWIGLIAVARQMRGRGLAKDLLKVCVDRTAELGHEAIKLRVDRENRPARRLYESAGFVCTSEKGSQCIYTRVCDSRERPPDAAVSGSN